MRSPARTDRPRRPQPAAALLLALLLAGCASRPGTPHPGCLELAYRGAEDVAEAIDALLRDHLIEAGLPGATLAWRIGAGPIRQHARGCADAERLTPMQPDMRLRLASLSKTVTALLAMRLAVDGKLDLDAPLESLAPSLLAEAADPRSRRITPRQLLGHCAGLDHGDDPDPFFRLPRRLRAEDPGRQPGARVLALARLTTPLDGEPGRDCGYSNIGYVLLQAAIEESLGEDYEALMLRLWEAALSDAGLAGAGPRIARSEPWLAGIDEPLHHDPREFPAMVDGVGDRARAAYGAFDLRWGTAAGGWLSSAAELVALVSGVEEALPPSARESLQKSLLPCRRLPCTALGRDVAGRGEQAFWFQLGDLPGSATLLAGRGDIRVAMLSNGSDEDPRRRLRLARQLLDLLVGIEAEYGR